MAEAAVAESSSCSFPFGRSYSDAMLKRKTPSELRGEQLKRRSSQAVTDGPFLAGAAFDKKLQSSKLPRYVNTRVDEVYLVKKSSERCRQLYGKDKTKEASTVIEISDDPVSCPSGLPAKAETSAFCANGLNNPKDSETCAKDINDQVFRKIEKCSQSTLRNVIDLHLGNETLSGSGNVDMDKALKGFSARDIPAISGSLASSKKLGDLPPAPSRISSAEFEIPGVKVPLDLTLKTSVRFVLSSPVKWCHRLTASPAAIDLSCFTQSFCNTENSNSLTGQKERTEILFSKALCSWVYPESSLPTSIISMMTSSGGKGETDFLRKRQQDWEDSFRNLYYMLRKNNCNIFYVYTSQFVVLFVGGNFLGEKKYSCNAYISQSTRSVRSLLRKHGICFKMPLCHAEMEQASEDDLVELKEIEKQNLGKAWHLDSLSDVDNSPHSLLSFVGNDNVHGLYDFLLNYRSILNSFSGLDVPVLYAPVLFHNASFHVPEVRSKEIRKADMILPFSSESDAEECEAMPNSHSSIICYSLEIKDVILPPWVVSRLCAVMSADQRGFDSTLTTDSRSVGLNIALNSLCQKSMIAADSNKSAVYTGSAFGISEAISTPHLELASLRRLTFSEGTYMAYSVPI